MIGRAPVRSAHDATDLVTPQPAYRPNDFKGTEPPELLPSPHKLRAMNAAVRARRLYPGPAGELLEREINAYADMGYLAAGSSAVRRLVDQLMADELPDNVA